MNYFDAVKIVFLHLFKRLCPNVLSLVKALVEYVQSYSAIVWLFCVS